MYLWESDDKNGKQLPLPCEKCNLWFSRLDHHFEKKHKMLKTQCSESLTLLRQKYWGRRNDLDGKPKLSCQRKLIGKFSGQEDEDKQYELRSDTSDSGTSGDEKFEPNPLN